MRRRHSRPLQPARVRAQQATTISLRNSSKTRIETSSPVSSDVPLQAPQTPDTTGRHVAGCLIGALCRACSNMSSATHLLETGGRTAGTGSGLLVPRQKNGAGLYIDLKFTGSTHRWLLSAWGHIATTWTGTSRHPPTHNAMRQQPPALLRFPADSDRSSCVTLLRAPGSSRSQVMVKAKTRRFAGKRQAHCRPASK